MWNPIRIEMYNFFSHKESFYDFKNNSCTVIFGRNETDTGLENNGAGKTTLFEAISIALTNESLRNIKKESFINRDEEECKIIFILHNPVLKMKLKISRVFYRSNKPVEIKIWENNELQKQIVSVNEANAEIIKLIGISREDLLRYFLISQDNKYTFFTATDVEKKEIMNRITSADMINPIIKELDDKYQKINGEYKTINEEISKLTSKVELIVEQIEEAESSDNTKEEIESILEEISLKQEEVEKVKNILKINKQNLSVIDKSISDIKIEDISDLKKKRKELKVLIQKLDDDIIENERMEKKLNSELNDTITCPNCNHEFLNDSDLDLSINDIKKLIKELKTELTIQSDNYSKNNEKLKKVNEKIKKTEEKEEELSELNNDKDKVERIIKNKTQEQKDLLNKISKLEEEIKVLQQKKKDNKLILNLQQKKKDIDSEIKIKQKQLEPLSEELELISFWKFNMGKNGFTTYLANKSIKVIEGITNSFLRKFNVDISVLINGFKILKSGEVREKIDVFVLNDGVTAELFMAKSGGERGRVMLAGILGIQHLINLSTNGRGLNLLCFDECFHGMDSRGQESIIKIFEKMGITILVISQNINDSFNNENTLYVVKENDVSRYI